MRAFFLLFTTLLVGCSGMPIHNDFYEWRKEREPLPFTWHFIPQEAVQAYCSHTKSPIYACAYWDHEQCWIFTRDFKRLTPDMVWHEERHCNGWNHQVI